jgi:APA family basic amino acid/polyamine antiporter
VELLGARYAGGTLLSTAESSSMVSDTTGVAVGKAPQGGLGVLDATLLVVGSMVGAGIFLMAPYVARDAGSSGAFVATWILGGVVSLCGALSNGELGGLFPRSGGEYVYLRQAYGPIFGFLSGWTTFWVAFPGSIAALASGFGTAMADMLGVRGSLAATYIGAVAVLVLTVLNGLGLRPGKWVQNVLSGGKMSAFAVLLVLGMFVPARATTSVRMSGATAAGVAVALVSTMFAYSGWNAATYIAGEIRNPARTLGRSLAIGTLACTVLYVAVNLSYLRAMPIEELARATDPARTTALRLGGPRVAALLGPLVAVCILSSLQATVQVGPHLYRSMAVDRVFFRWLGTTSPKTGAPLAALGAQAAIAMVELLSNRFDQLIELVMVPLIAFSTMTVAAVFVLRRRLPDAPRPFRVPAYPFVPLLFVVVNAWVLWSVFAHSASEPWVLAGLRLPSPFVGVGIVVSGIPVFFVFRARMREQGGHSE